MNMDGGDFAVCHNRDANKMNKFNTKYTLLLQ